MVFISRTTIAHFLAPVLEQWDSTHPKTSQAAAVSLQPPLLAISSFFPMRALLLFGSIVSLLAKKPVGRLAIWTAFLAGAWLACSNASKGKQTIPSQTTDGGTRTPTTARDAASDGGIPTHPKDAAVIPPPPFDGGITCSPETCDGMDNDCDGYTDEGFGIGALCTKGMSPCERSGRFYCMTNGRVGCDAPEVAGTIEIACNGRDEDCDGADYPGTDTDDDGFRTEGGSCGPIDCNDENPNVNPEAVELACNMIDENCDGVLKQGADVDEDGYMPQGGPCGPVDCNDRDPGLHPNAAAGTCAGIDYDCDGAVALSRLLPADMRVSASPQAYVAHPDIAFTGTHFGIVWFSSPPFPSLEQIRFALVDMEGNLASTELTLTNHAVRLTQPKIVWTGTEFHVSWVENNQSHLARISPQGGLVALPTTVGTTRSLTEDVDHIWTGNESLLVRAALHGAGPREIRLFLTRVDGEGNPIGEDTLLQTLPGIRWPALVSNGINHVLAWDQAEGSLSSLKFAPFYLDGSVGPETTVASGAEEYRAIALQRGEESYGIAWVEGTLALEAWHRSVRFAVVKADGTALDPKQVAELQDDIPNAEPSLAWTGEEYRLVWNEIVNNAQRIWSASFSPEAVKNGEPTLLPLPSNFATADPAIVALDGGLAMVWYDTRDFHQHRLGPQIYWNRFACR